VTLDALKHSTVISIPDEIMQVIEHHDPFTPLEPFDVNAEQFEEFSFPFSIDESGYALSGYSNTLKTKTLYKGEPTKIKSVFYLPSELVHLSLYTNIRDGETLFDSDTFIRFWKGKDNEIRIEDESGFFETADLTIQKDGIKITAIFDITFAKPMEKSDIILRMWDSQLHSAEVLIFDAFEVAQDKNEVTFAGKLQSDESSLQEYDSLENIRDELNESRPIPIWIKVAAGWWSEKKITDSDFVLGIQHMIQNDIIKIQNLPEYDAETAQENIPDWIKNNADWWANDQISDEEFKQSLQWLIANGVMEI